MQLVDGSCPEQEHADKFSTVSPFPRPLVSPDTTYEVNFTLSSLISAPISRCLCHIHRSGRDPQPAGRARSLPRNAHRSRPFKIVILAAIHYNMAECCPFREIDTVLGTLLDERESELWLIFSRQTLQRIYRVSSPADRTFQCECNSSAALKATRPRQTSISTRWSLSFSQTVTKVTQAPSCFPNRPP